MSCNVVDVVLKKGYNRTLQSPISMSHLHSINSSSFKTMLFEAFPVFRPYSSTFRTMRSRN